VNLTRQVRQDVRGIDRRGWYFDGGKYPIMGDEDRVLDTGTGGVVAERPVQLRKINRCTLTSKRDKRSYTCCRIHRGGLID
jgi:hypothetical protein